MFLLNPNKLTRAYPDTRSKEIMEKTVAFFETKGKTKLKEDDRERIWYQDFIDFLAKENIFEALLTPQEYGDGETRWDTWRNCEFSEILGFYGLQYWYVWQVTILGLGPIWMSQNEAAKKKAAKLLQDGEIFAFGLSEKTHGADVYSTDMLLTPKGSETWQANGSKYYIGNGNAARMVSTFGKLVDSDEYTWFVADSQAGESYECVKNIVNSQNYVAEYALHDYKVTSEDILHKGDAAFHAALNTVNVGKFNLGWGSIGICTHAMYEAVTHAHNRHLYGMTVTDFPHAQQNFIDAYTRLLAMKLFAGRASDYMRTASADDRRYLLYNPMVKMKVTCEGERVITAMWDIIAAKGFEKDMYFEMAARDIQALPRLEGTVHVNIALILKFMPNFLFNPSADLPDVGTVDAARNDDYLFNQGATRGLGKIQFQDPMIAYDKFDLPNVNLFKEQIGVFKQFLMTATPDDKQQKDIDFLMSLGELFSLIVYGQLILENAEIYKTDDQTVDQIFDFMVRDFSKYAIDLHGKRSSTEAQQELTKSMVRKPAVDDARYKKVLADVLAMSGAYEMKP